eukprot:scaffold55932_cov30-Tisochrysis_lutea.AAC.2
MGSARLMKGSNVSDTLSHTGQQTCDLKRPSKRSAMVESYRRRCLASTSAATTSSGSPLASKLGTYGCGATRLTSSLSRSSRKLQSSCESCWPKPANCGPIRPSTSLNARGETGAPPPSAIARNNSAKARESSPPVEKTLRVLTCGRRGRRVRRGQFVTTGTPR